MLKTVLLNLFFKHHPVWFYFNLFLETEKANGYV